MNSICVFCGSSLGDSPHFVAAAAALGRELAAAGLSLVYGGAMGGLMGAVADATIAAGGRVVGVLAEDVVTLERAHPGLNQAHRVPSLAARKALMAELADAFIALPGGLGTYDELFELLTLRAIGATAAPIALLDVSGYYRPLLRLLEHGVARGFIGASVLAEIICGQNPAEVVRAVVAASGRLSPAAP